MCSLDCFEVEVEGASLGIRADSGVARVCKRTGLAIAEARDIVFVAAEGLGLRVESERKLSAGQESRTSWGRVTTTRT
jgi:hypothetical protein